MSKKAKQKKKNDQIKGSIILGFVGLLAIWFGFSLYDANDKFIELHPETNCRIDGVSPRETVILLDSTESLSEAQVETVINHLNHEIENAILFERFTVYSLKAEPERFQPQFSVCNPGDGSDKSFVNNNPRKILKKWETLFKDPILRAVTMMGYEEASQTSPVMEMLKFVGIRTFARSKSDEKRMILISDMVENTSKYSQYSDLSADFRANRDTPYFRKVKPRLLGVDVHILYIERSNLTKIQGKKHLERFWKPFLEASGGALSSITYIN